MLGHASATVTLDTYSHVFPSLAEPVEGGLRAGVSGGGEARRRAEVTKLAVTALGVRR
jgi:hypothetical protein